jgi:hypothetical protein
MQRHHIVQSKYLTQWRKKDDCNQLNIYVIKENGFKEKGPNWKGFWRKDYNIYDDENDYYLPEKITEKIDTEGIEVIRKIDTSNKLSLSDYDRSVLSFYITLQYFRTPRFREEQDKFFEETIKYFMRKDITTPEKFKIRKADILKEKPKNDKEKAAIEKIKTMTDEEIQNDGFNFLHSDDFKIKLSNVGHSKIFFKIDRRAEELFKFVWTFLIAPKDTFFTTSDNPCFTFSTTKFQQGLLSPNVTIFFPLRPDLCIVVKPRFKSYEEGFLHLSKKEVRDINKLVLSNSYYYFIAKDIQQLQHLTKSYDYKNHKQSRNTAIYEKGPYIMFNLE